MIVKSKGGFYRRFVKRPMDFILASVSIILLSPVMLVVGVLVRLKLGSPILFTQQRPGFNEKVFKMYKFRTMTDARDEDGQLLPNDQRYTKFGNFLRSTSLDELPGLINIVRGDMSIIGPRPLLVEYLALYNEQQKRRHEVRPGLSGLAQVSGRNAITWEDKFHLDVKYVDSVSFVNDIKIILLTVKKVFVREGINFDDSVQDTKFRGTSTSKKSEVEL